VAVKRPQASADFGGFVGAKNFIEHGFDLEAEVVGGREFLDDGDFFGRRRPGFGAELRINRGDCFVIFGCQFAGMAGAEIVDGRVARTAGFAFWRAGSGGPLGVAAIGRQFGF
jgi:hypothetical protein